MVTFKALQDNRRQLLVLTGLTLPEFRLLLTAFAKAYQHLHPTDQTVAGQPRRRTIGGGRKGLLHHPEDKLVFILVYLKTYPLQAVMAELFDLSQPQVNYWIHRLLPALREALEERGDRPARNGRHFAPNSTASPAPPRLIIDGTERRRQRPKNPEKQALHYSGKKKTHGDKNLVIVTLPGRRIDFLSRTYVGKTHDKKMADTEDIAYPPEAILYKDTGFQGYEPVVRETRQPKKKATPRRTH
jgi:DDE superfamily endonuclease